MVISDIMYQRGPYSFKESLAKVILKKIVIGFRDLFLALMPAKISVPKNINPPPLTNLLSCNIVSITR